MKKLNRINRPLFRTIGLSLLMATFLVMPSCSDDDDEIPVDNTVAISASLNSDQETAEVNSTATGTLSGTYNKKTYELKFTLSWDGLTGAPAMMHFHGPAVAGVDAGVLVGISGFPASASGSFSSEVLLPVANINDLLSGKVYVNIHTQAYPAGEIRGQVSAASGGNNGGDNNNGDGGDDPGY